MLKLIISGEELFNNKTQLFSTATEPVEIELNHSLISLSRWESFFEKPFLSTVDKTEEEVLAYVKYMIVDDNVDESTLKLFSRQDLEKVNDYINSKQTATTFRETRQPHGPKEIITSELIYYWMVAFQIPFECENWHLNRLFALVKICNIKNSKPVKQSSNEIAQRNRELNEQRKAQLGTAG